MKVRIDNKANYKAVFTKEYKTIRMRIDSSKEISRTSTEEILDIGINTKCLAACSYCYTSAIKKGYNFSNIIEKAKLLWGNKSQHDKPFQVAIGGSGEPTLHDDFIEYMRVLREELGIVPNYTTNGMHLSDAVLEATEKYSGGVALSYHKHISKTFHMGIEKLSKIKTKLNVHIIIGEEGSVDDFLDIYNTYNMCIDYFVLLPYQNAGRAKSIDVTKEWDKLFIELNKINKDKIAFGALFYEYLKAKEISSEIDMYEPELFSGYVLMDDNYNIVYNSSYDLTKKRLIPIS